MVVEFDSKHNIMRATPDGEMTGTILVNLYERAAEYMSSHPPCHGILDLSRVTKFEVSSDAIRQVAAAAPAFPAGYLRIVVIQKDFIYGLARMFQMLTEDTRPDLHVVRTMEDALRLLQVDSPEFEHFPV